MSQKLFDYLKWCILPCMLVYSASVNAQCTIDAGPASVNLCSGQSITIGGSPTLTGGNGTEVLSWTNGAGSSANPSVSPASTTTYTVSVTGGGCQPGLTDQITVNVLPSPNASFTFAPNNQPCANVPIAFTNTSTGCTGCQFVWNWGDGTPNSTQANPSHTFNATPGTGTQNFTVTLTITASNGCSSTFSTTVTVKRIPDPVLLDPFFSQEDFLLCDGQSAVSLTLSDGSVGPVSNYNLNWGDGTPVYNGATPPNNLQHTYATGVYTLAYTLTATNGCVVVQNFPVYNISNPAISTGSIGGTQACGPIEFCFSLDFYQNNHPSTYYEINFGDGTPVFTVNHVDLQSTYCHTYTTTHCPTPGFVFQVNAVNGCSATPGSVGGIKVGTPPTASFTATPQTQCVNANILFVNNSTSGFNFNNCNSGTTYTWNFGDGSNPVTVPNTSSQSHAYTTPGTYTVTLTATHAQCGSHVITQQVCIVAPPVPNFTLSPTPICLNNNQNVTTVNTSTSSQICNTATTTWVVDYAAGACPPNAGTFNYMSGTSASSLQPVFQFNSVGTYTVRLRMTNVCGVFEDTEPVVINTTPTASITVPTSVCAGTSGNFSATTSGCGLGISNYVWTFTGGTPSTFTGLNPPAITYANAGTYPVTLTVTNPCGSVVANGSVVVVPAPVVNIVASDSDNNICNGQATTLTASGATSFTWSPATYLSSTSGSVVTSTPTGPITYTVTGTSGSCTDTETISLTIAPLPMVQPSGTFTMCSGQTIQLGLTVTGGSGTYTSYNWTPAQNLTSYTIANPVSNATSSINYSVQVTDNQGCIGVGTVPVVVNPLPPTNAGPDITLCNQPVATNLTGFSPTTGGTGVWSGPGVTSAGVFTPSTTGSFTLTYCFTSATTGCSACDNMVVTVQNPTPANGGPDIFICQGNPPVQLPAGLWSGSPNISPTGLFTPSVPTVVNVVVTQGAGSCATTDTVTVTVRPLPVANAGPDVTVCAGSTVNLQGLCTNCPNGPIDFCTWSGGAGVVNPLTCTPTTNVLNSTSTYNLTVVDVAGCTASDQITIFVNPLPNTNAGADMQVCNQPFVTQLSGSPAGGTWSGTGVTPSGAFTPTGVGSFTLTYCYTNPVTNCTRCDDMIMQVLAPQIANAGPNVNICLNQPAFNLNTSTPGGTWSGVAAGTPVTSSGNFNPNQAGVYNVVYTLGTGTCLTTDTTVITVHTLPTVNAGANTAICSGSSTNLNATVSGGAPGYQTQWNFASTLSNSSILNPVATPTVTTNYTLTVTDANQCVVTSGVTVTVIPLTAVNAGNDLTLCNQPIAQVLTGFSPPTGPLGTGVWSGTGITNASGVFTPNGTGTFWAYYTFTAGGNNCVAVDSIQITVVPPVFANAGADVTLCLNEGLYQLTNFSPQNSVTWSGPGVVSSANGTIQTETAGEGTHTYTINFGSGTCATTDQMQMTILPLPNVNAGPGATLCGNAAAFNMPGFVPATGGTWQGTGITNTSTGAFDPTIGPGTYNLLYFFTDAITGCSDTAFTNVTISPVPVANFTLANINCTNLPVVYTNTSTGATQYNWTYGNGAQQTGLIPTYTYPTGGFYNIRLIAQNNFGCADTAVNAHEVIAPPVASIALSPNTGCAPLQVDFTNNSTGLYVTYNWNLATTTSNLAQPPAVVYQQGPDVLTYPVSLVVSNQCGSSTANELVTVLPQPVASFGTNLNVFCSPFVVEFNNTSVGLPETFFWDFGDGTTGIMEEPGTHPYYADTIAVDYTIWLYLSNQCGLDTASHTITVLPNTVTAFFNTSITQGCEPLQVAFTNFSQGGNQISYNLGDGQFTANDNPIHTYQAGIYTIYQFVDNGCSYDTAQVTITVFDSPDIDFTTNVPNLCINNTAQMIPQLDTAVEVFWDFGDGSTSELSAPSHEFTTPGTLVITMTAVSDNNCSSTVSHPFTVFPGPTASFSIPDMLGCSPFQACFTNNTIGGNFYTWNFGNGNTSNNVSPCHTYTNVSAAAVLQTVTLIAQDLQLCADTFQLNVIVAPQPISAFQPSSTSSCYTPAYVSVQNNSQFANGYDWYLDGSPYSELVNPTFVFDEVANHQIVLVASNQFGCTATSTSPFNVYPLPELLLDAAPLSGCVPLEVDFANTSTGAVSYLWQFGDGATSAAAEPVHQYGSPGVYDVSLIATTVNGCIDTLSYDNYITVHQLPMAAFTTDRDETTIYDPEFRFYNQSVGAVAWLYQFGDGSSAALPNVMHRYNNPGYWPVTLTVTNQYGCTDTYGKVVVINDIFDVFVPNTFTPDGDGINEVFLPQISGKPFLNKYLFQIFNRWGVVIFQTNDPEMAWTGDVRDGEYYAQDDAYNWRIEVQLKGTDEERIYSGHVMVLR